VRRLRLCRPRQWGAAGWQDRFRGQVGGAVPSPRQRFMRRQIETAALHVASRHGVPAVWHVPGSIATIPVSLPSGSALQCSGAHGACGNIGSR
jgi:hypothetical protein